MKHIVKIIVSSLIAFLIVLGMSAFADNTVKNNTELSINKTTTVFTAFPSVITPELFAVNSEVEIVSKDTIHLKAINIYNAVARNDKKPLDKLLRFVKKDPKFYTIIQNNTIQTEVIDLPKLLPLKPIEAYVSLMTPLPPILQLIV